MKTVRRVVRREKTAEIVLGVHSCRILSASIAGDFFAYPETCIEDLERRLLGCGSEECIRAAFDAVRSCEIVGVSWRDLEDAVIDCWREGCGSS